MIDLQAACFAVWKDPSDEAIAALLRQLPDAPLASETARRRGAKTVNRSGGKVWGHHRPGDTRCRCAKCNRGRDARKGAAA